nr:MAG TPA: hypothetical protein [Caudoviricetes sp.]
MLLIITASVPISFVQQMLSAEIMVQVGFTKLLKQKDLTNVNILNF